MTLPDLSPLPDAELARGLKMAEAATQGPWEKTTSQRIDGPDYAEVIYPGQVECMAYCYGGSSTIEGDNLDADLEFIAFARTALPRALAELRVLRVELDGMRRIFTDASLSLPVMADRLGAALFGEGSNRG